VKTRYLLFVPPLALLLYFVARLVVPDALLANRAANVVSFAIAAAGCMAAARGFAKGDYLRTAWYLQGISYGILIASAAIQRPGLAREPMLVRVGIIFIANLLSVVGTVLFARAYRVAGLELPWSRRARITFLVVVILLAAAAALPPLFLQLGPALHGDLPDLTGVFSSTGDFITFCLLAPLFMTAVALRGGLLVWPWALFTAGTICWLLYDAQDTLTYFIPWMTEEPLQIWVVPLRILACTLTFAAGIAQRRLSLGDAQLDSEGPPG